MKKRQIILIVLFVLWFYLLLFTIPQKKTPTLNEAVTQASQTYHVPKDLLLALCYREGHLSNHNGYPSEDNGYGCMHLVKNDRVDTLDEAATLLHEDTSRLQTSLPDNISGGAALLAKEAIQLSPDHRLPDSLAGWYGAVGAYSHATTKQVALMYADAVYALINQGFISTSDTGETVILKPYNITPNKKTADPLHPKLVLPKGCVIDSNTDYPGAIDCELNPSKYNCNSGMSNALCTYEEADRPADFPITFIIIHYFEQPLFFAFSLFHNPASNISIHYLVDTDGTVYQLLPEKDIAYHVGNFWYNQHSIGIEHTGYVVTGYQWYNAAEYLASARLTAYLAKKYKIPLDHEHILSHGTVPAPTLGSSPNHVDPGPYWSWETYFSLIHQQGISYPEKKVTENVISLRPEDQFSFFPLYSGPGTKYPLIPSAASVADRIDETSNIESNMSYYVLNTITDTAGSGDRLYQLWYGENDTTYDTDLFSFKGVPGQNSVRDSSEWFAHAKRVWLASPSVAVSQGVGTVVQLTDPQEGNLAIYGVPVSDPQYTIGDTPNGAIFVSAFTQTEEDTDRLWYEINYNHRQAWIPSSEVTVIKP